MTNRAGKLIASARPALIVAGVAIVAQAAYLAEGPADPTFLTPIVDADVYHDAAVRFAAGGPLSDGPFWQPPLWPAVLGVLYVAVGPSVLAAKLLLAALAVGSCLLVGHVTARLFSERVGVVAGVMLAVYGPFVFLSTQLLPVGLCVFLLLVSVLLLLRAMDDPSVLSWGAVGVVVGLAVITVPNTVVVLLWALGWLVAGLLRTPRRLAPLAHATALVAGFATILVPVAARNYAASPGGPLVLISTNGGVNLFIGNNPRSDATVAIRPGEHCKSLTRQPLVDGIADPAGQSAWFTARVRDYAASDPSGFLRGLARKLALVVNAREIPRNIDLATHREFSRVLSALVWRLGPVTFPLGVVAPLAVVGVLVAPTLDERGRRLRGRRLMPVVLAIGYAVSVAMFFVASRHRLPAVVLLMPLAALGAAWLVRLAGRGGHAMPRGERMLVLAVAALSAVMVNLSVASPADGVNFKAEMLMCVAHARLDAGDLDAADQWFERSLEEDPAYAAALIGWAQVASLRGDAETAESRLRRAMEIDERSSEARSLLAQLCLQLGRLDEAIALFQDALDRDPFLPPALGGLSRGLAAKADRCAAAEQFADARGYYLKAVELPEVPAEVQNRAAWFLATCPRAEFRDCAAAVRLAERLCERTQRRHAVALDTLAAAYAECGRLREAVAVARAALELARGSGATESITSRLRQYEDRLAHLEGGR